MKKSNLLLLGAGAVALFLMSRPTASKTKIINDFYESPILPDVKQVPNIIDSEMGYPHFVTEPRPPYPSNDRADFVNCWDSTTKSYQFRSVSIQHWLNS